MQVDLYVVTYNQIKMLPIVTEYWKRYQLRKIVIFDNLSTDGTVDYVREHFPFVEVQYNNTKLKDNRVIRDWKNNAWKASRGLADFVIVCDCDEVLYHPILVEELELAKGYSHLVHKPALACVTETKVEPVTGELYHNLDGVKFNRCNADFGKVLLFDPNLVQESNYSVGYHQFNPKGAIKPLSSSIELLHFDYLDLEFLLNRYSAMNKRRSQEDIKRGFGVHYAQCADDLTRQWKERLLTSKKASEASNIFELTRR